MHRLQAQRSAETSSIRMQQLLAEKAAARHQAEIDDDMFRARQRALADAEHYRWGGGGGLGGRKTDEVCRSTKSMMSV